MLKRRYPFFHIIPSGYLFISCPFPSCSHIFVDGLFPDISLWVRGWPPFVFVTSFLHSLYPDITLWVRGWYDPQFVNSCSHITPWVRGRPVSLYHPVGSWTAPTFNAACNASRTDLASITWIPLGQGSPRRMRFGTIAVLNPSLAASFKRASS